jgi:hypothetical protein
MSTLQTQAHARPETSPRDQASVRPRRQRANCGLAVGGEGVGAAKVRLACHPHDPYTPPGYRGVTRVLGTG